MRHRNQTEYRRSQDSVSYVPRETAENTKAIDRSKYFSTLYPYMFIEDVKNSVMPIGGRRFNQLFDAKLEPSNPEFTKMIAQAISRDEYVHDFEEELCDFVSNCAVDLLLFETSTYELVYLFEAKEKTGENGQDGKPVAFEFIRIPPLMLLTRGNALFQALPINLATELDKPTEIELKPERTLTFRLPGYVRGKIGELMDLLSILSNPISPTFYMEEMALGSLTTPYSVKDHIRMRKIALARASRLFGWNARFLLFEDLSEYFWIHRRLLFERFIVCLRDSILDTLTQGINRAGERIGFSIKISMSGIPTLTDVESAFEHLKNGDVSFAELRKPFSK